MPRSNLPPRGYGRAWRRRSAGGTALRVALLGATMSCVLAPAAWAESLPASVRACAQEPDSLKRLICYDREVARYNDQPSGGQSPTVGPSGRDLRSTPTTPTVPPGPPREDRSDSGPGQAQPSPPIPPPAPAPPPAPKHVSARIVKIENFPDAIVVHLDNGQVWEQIQEASASVSLRPGDTISIDREMAAFWMSGKDGVAVKVRQKQ
jgi:hypothetical protein